MVIKYNIEIEKEAIIKNLNRIINQIFKLLPSREEGGEWLVSLENLITELSGMSSLLEDHVSLFSLLCKLEALRDLTGEDDFFQFRKTIFECLNLCSEIKKCLD